MKHTKHILALALTLALVFFASTPSYAVVPNHLHSDIIKQFCDVYGVSIKHYTDAQGPKQPNFIWAHSTPWVDTKPRPDNILDTEEWGRIEKLFQKYANEFDETYHVQLLDGSHRNIILADDITIVPNDEDLSDYTISLEPERNSETGELLYPTPTPTPTPAPTPTPEPTTPTTYTAKATNDKLTVDGVSKAPTAYKINNANYFQLRDVAVLLNSTKAQFSVDYDDTAKAIKITTGQPYQPNGKEMKGAKATAEAIVGNNDVYINGVKTDFAVYKIGGSNFFQIRDLGKALGFNVDWAKDVGIIIDPSSPYSGK